MSLCTLLFVLAACPQEPTADALPIAWNDHWAAAADRRWLGPDLWGNRLQDWRLEDGALVCSGPAGLRFRTAILAGARGRADERRQLAVTVWPVAEDLERGAWAGFLVGAGGAGPEDDAHPLHGLLVQGTVGRGFGWFCGVSASGALAIERLDSAEAVERLDGSAREVGALPGLDGGVRLVLDIEPRTEGSHRLVLTAFDVESGERLASLTNFASGGDLPDGGLRGQIGLVADPGPSGDGPGAALRFEDFEVRGAADRLPAGGRLGPVVSTLYTVSGGTLKLTAQLLPLGARDLEHLTLTAEQPGRTGRGAAATLRRDSWTATFRIEDWDSSLPGVVVIGGVLARRRGAPPGAPRTFAYSTSIAAEPGADAELSIALLNCCHQVSHDLVGGWGATGGVERGDWRDGSWFPHADLVANVAAHQPDLYAFVGDQVYEGASPTGVDRANLTLDYLYKWTLWCLAFRDLTSVRPTIVLPDDHDVYQGNVWGEGGIATEDARAGGYANPASFVDVVEATQTAHLPDTAHPGGTIAQGLPARYGELIWGGASIAVLEDRKWKSGCLDERLPNTDSNRPDHWLRAPEDPAELDPPGLELLGPEQEAFLERWAAADRGGRLKVAVSQSPFAALATHHGKHLQRLAADLDSNGWPRSGRERAVGLLRAAGAVHLAGDQHLATLVQHGLAEHGDAVFGFTGPSIANFYPRAWWPGVTEHGHPGEEFEPDDYTGDFVDGFGNRITVHAAANPMDAAALAELAGRELGRPALHEGMPGYGVVRVDASARKITFECWPRFAGPGGAQYPGWPVRIAVGEDGVQRLAE